MDLYDDYLYEVIDELESDSNFVFVKLRGKDVGKPMEYWNVESLFKSLKKKTSFMTFTCSFSNSLIDER